MTGMFCNIFANRKLVVDFLAVLFGISTWISINGMFVQLPLMVQTQPERWNLPSFLSVIIQLANLGPVMYSISQKFFPERIKDSWLIGIILIIGSVASLLMALFYYKTTIVASEEHSTALFVLSFFGAVVGCTSSVLFMPYIGKFFREIYLISYFIGEGLSGFLPSVVALIQGVGGNPVCVPDPSNNSTLIPYTSPPHFSTESFFYFLFAMMTIGTIAFFLLNNLTVCKSERTDCLTRSPHNTEYSEAGQKDSGTIYTLKEDIEALMNDADMTKINNNLSPDDSVVKKTDNKTTIPVTETQNDTQKTSLSKYIYIYFLVLASWVCMFGNGIFPSIQSYSCLPYGNTAYHLSVTLGSMANPIACFLTLFFPSSSTRVISLLSFIGTVIIGYIMSTALLSPVPPLVNTSGGEALVVLSWVAVTGLITYVKVSITKVFQQEGGRALFWCGAVQQLGSAVGAIVFFFLINFTNIFVSYYPCA